MDYVNIGHLGYLLCIGFEMFSSTENIIIDRLTL